jgi:hypothetical protein
MYMSSVNWSGLRVREHAMQNLTQRNRYIPFRKVDIVEMCINDARLSPDDRESFRGFCRILESLFHFEFHRQLEELKGFYAPFNPDADTRTIHTYKKEQKLELQRKLVESLTLILNAANFEKVTGTDLKEALREESLFEVRLEVDFEDFEEVIFYRRGESRRRETLVKLFGLKKEPIEFTNYDRVVIYVKFKEADHFQVMKRENLYFTPGSTLIKLFQNVPKADLEMLFPNSQVRMKTMDKLLIGVPAVISGTMVVATKLGASILLIGSLIAFWLGLAKEEVRIEQRHLVALALGLATLGGFIVKQINKFKNRKIKIMKALTENLYFKNLDNNAGVFHHLIDAAEEEEFKEAVLAYYFLLTADGGLTKSQLDAAVEQWFENKHSCRIDFEIEDALYKLERLELVKRDGGIIHCKSLNEAKRHLDRIWDNCFTYYQTSATGK